MIDHFEKDETNYSEFYCTVLDERKTEKKTWFSEKNIIFHRDYEPAHKFVLSMVKLNE